MYIGSAKLPCMLTRTLGESKHWTSIKAIQPLAFTTQGHSSLLEDTVKVVMSSSSPTVSPFQLFPVSNSAILLHVKTNNSARIKSKGGMLVHKILHTMSSPSIKYSPQIFGVCMKLKYM